LESEKLLARAARHVGLARVEHVLADARVDQRALAVQVLLALREAPALPLRAARLRRERAVEAVRADRLRHVDVDPADRVDQVFEAGEVDATILALAGLKRLGLSDRATVVMSEDEFLPAAGQGAIGIETREDNDRVRDILARVDHGDTSVAIACERAFLCSLDGSCKTPIAGHATVSGDAVQFRGLIARPDGSAAHDIAGTGKRKDAATIGAEAGRELKHRAGVGFFD